MNRSIASTPTNSMLSRAASLARISTVAVAFVVMSGLVAAGSVGGMNSSDTREDLISVNRVNKGDRLTRMSTDRSSQNSTSIEVVVPRKRVPLGCDPAFSPFVDPALAHIYKRCMA